MAKEKLTKRLREIQKELFNKTGFDNASPNMYLYQYLCSQIQCTLSLPPSLPSHSSSFFNNIFFFISSHSKKKKKKIFSYPEILLQIV